MTGRSGRRPGTSDTKDAILHAARRTFGDRGYDAASIRAIASAAAVDPALVHHYFGTKQQLFLAAVNAPIDPGEILSRVINGNRADIGHRLVRTFVTVWDGPAGITAAAMLRSAIGNEWAGKLFREFIVTQVLRRVRAELGLDTPDAPLRMSLVASQMAGLAMVRYVLRIEPLASAPAEVIVAAIGPTLQRYLTGDVSARP
jgi:AcrR family transcriptional regulator